MLFWRGISVLLLGVCLQFVWMVRIMLKWRLAWCVSCCGSLPVTLRTRWQHSVWLHHVLYSFCAIRSRVSRFQASSGLHVWICGAWSRVAEVARWGGSRESGGWILLRYEPGVEWKHFSLAGLKGSRRDAGEEAHLWRRGSQWGRRTREQTVWITNDLQTPGTTYRCEKYFSVSSHSWLLCSPSVSCDPFPSGPSAVPAGKVQDLTAPGRRKFTSWLIIVPSMLSAGLCQLVASHKLKTLEQIVVMRNK